MSASLTDLSYKPDDLSDRRERVFLVLAGTFLCAMTMLNILGITRFIQLGPMALAIGILPYPLTFLCTDLICELYGKNRANFLVTVGLVLNFLILLVLFLGQAMPAVDTNTMPPWQVLSLSEDIALPNGTNISGDVELFDLIYALSSGAIFASMIAYMVAQYCDVQLFHFLKRLTKGKHLWLRNNLSTLTSQGVDSFIVIGVTFGAVYWRGDISGTQFLMLMGSNYLFKMTVALLDTGPFYLLVYWLKRYLKISDH